MSDKLEDILVIDAGLRGPAEMAVKLAKSAKRKRNPVIDVLLITIDSEGKPGAAWTSMRSGELAELERFLRLCLDEHFRTEWELPLGEGEYDEEDG